MPSTILFVFEGTNPEQKITKGLTKHFVNENTNVECAFYGEIYQLYRKLQEDTDLDTFELIKTRLDNSLLLEDYNRSDFAEIYLFFDYDGHATNANDNHITEMLEFFDQETESGKLYISYPMAEALRHISDRIEFNELSVPAKKNINYKEMVGNEGDSDLQNLKNLPLTKWLFLLEMHLKKMNWIVNDSFTLPSSLITQLEIFANQLEKFIEKDESVAVISGFPVFILDYYGIVKTLGFLSEEEE